MAKTIHTLAYMVTADTRSFTQGMVLTKNELKATKQIMESTTSPVKQLGSEFSSLNGLLAKGAISHGQYNHAFNQLIAGHTAGIPVIWRFTSVLSLGNPILIAGAVAVAGMAAGLGVLAGGAAYATLRIREQITKIDDLIASAKKLGVGVSMLQAMGHAAALADIEIGMMTSGIESMAKAISKATFGKGGSAWQAKTAFQLLGLDPATLRAAKPEQQLQTIVDALGRMANQADKTRVALAIFGSADFLRLDASQIEHATKQLAAMGGGLSDLDVAVFGEFDDAVEDMNASLDVSWKRLTMAVIPALTRMADTLTDAIIEMNKSDDFVATLEAIGDVGLVAVNVLKAMAVEAKSLGESLSTLEGPVPRMIAEWVNEARAFAQLELAFRDKLPQAPGGPVRAKGSDNAAALKDAAEDAKKYATELERIADASMKLGQVGGNLVRSLQEQITTFGMTSREVKLLDAAASGASIGELILAASLDKTLTGMEEYKKLTDDTKSALKAARSPLEAYKDEMIDYRRALWAGIITHTEFEKLAKKAGERLPITDRPAGVNPMMQGSSAAAMFLAELRVRGTGEKDKTDIMVGVLKDIDKHIVEGKTTVPTTIPRLGAA